MRYRQKTLSLIAAIGVVAMLGVACGKTVGETIDDATITTRVKTALINAPNVAALAIDVDTFKGVVTLSGRVKTPDEAERALNAARQVSGVKDVKSTLQVIPAS